MYGQSGVRGIVPQRALSFSLYVLALILGIITIPLVLLGPSLIGQILPEQWGFLRWFYWPVVTLLTVASITSLYHVSTPVRERWLRDVPGALLTLAIWVLSSFVVRGVIAGSLGGSSIYGPLWRPSSSSSGCISRSRCSSGPGSMLRCAICTRSGRAQLRRAAPQLGEPSSRRRRAEESLEDWLTSRRRAGTTATSPTRRRVPSGRSCPPGPSSTGSATVGRRNGSDPPDDAPGLNHGQALANVLSHPSDG